MEGADVDYRNSSIAVADLVDGQFVVWHLATTRLRAGESPLAGAWVFDVEDRATWDRLTFARSCWATPEAAAHLSHAQTGTEPLLVDAGVVHQALLDRWEAVTTAFDNHAAARPSLITPAWPVIPDPLTVPDPPAVGTQITERTLAVARWFAGMVRAWDEMEKERTAKTRRYLHHLGGPAPLPLPLTAAATVVPIVAVEPDSGPALDFVAIDFETANSRRGSPCAVGLVRFRGGEPVAEWYEVMRPPEGVDHFDRFSVRVHGITAEMVADRPRFADHWPEIQEFIGDDFVVAHNAAFDMSVLREAVRLSALEPHEVAYVDTLRAARRSLDLLSYSLPWVADALDVPLDQHHNALADARASGHVYVALALAAADSPDGWASVPIRVRGASQPPPTADPTANADHPLYGAMVAFTGGLDSMTRREAWDELASVGGTPQQSVTRQTTHLVIGPSEYQGQVLAGDAMTGKMRKAAELRAKGQRIEIMSEDDFLRSL